MVDPVNALNATYIDCENIKVMFSFRFTIFELEAQSAVLVAFFLACSPMLFCHPWPGVSRRLARFPIGIEVFHKGHQLFVESKVKAEQAA